jgi:hypothetical protein
MRQNNKIKKLSDYIMTFAFGYSSLICFSEAAERWENNIFIAIIIFICGMFSFIAIFRLQIDYLYKKMRNKKK